MKKDVLNQINFKNKYFRLLILIIVFGIIINIGYKKFKVVGGSMKGSYADGETVMVDKTTHKMNQIKRGDVVVFISRKDDEYMIKRIIGLPNEVIEIIDGDIYIDGILHKDEFSHQKIRVMLVGAAGIPLRDWRTNQIVYENENVKFAKLKEDEYWVIGDNRSDSWYGVIYKDNIEGEAK